jgi:hypothetical protein
MPPPLTIDVSYWTWRRTQERFCVELVHPDLDALVSDALHGYRVYELLNLRRPGAIWDYVGVRLVDVIDDVRDSFNTQWKRLNRASGVPEGGHLTLSYAWFDSLFCAAGDDTEPHHDAWFGERNGPMAVKYRDDLFAWIVATQESMTTSEDILIRHEVSLFASHCHMFDFTLQPPFMEYDPDRTVVVNRPRSDSYYAKLGAILTAPGVNSVTAFDSKDYTATRALFAEQRRRATERNLGAFKAFPISIFGDRITYVKHWCGSFHRFDEGLAYGDLYISQSTGEDADRIAYRVHDLNDRFPHLLLCEHVGELRGYQCESQDDWHHYWTETPMIPAYPAVSREEMMRLIKLAREKEGADPTKSSTGP